MLNVQRKKIINKWQLSHFIYDEKCMIYILPENELEAFNYSDGFKIEKYIFRSIKNAKDTSDGSEELMLAVRDWPSCYHLDVGRSNILKSLDISTGANVLEIGSGCGALTRYLGENFKSVDAVEGSFLRAQITRERCRNLENVRVFCSNVENLIFTPVYDIVTLIGVLEYAPLYFSNGNNAKESCLAFLRHVKKALKKEGSLVVAIENKVGIKYWGGSPEDHTGKIYDSIHGYSANQSPTTFSKEDLRELLTGAGFSDITFYYCFPDYKFASTIISSVGDEKAHYLHNWIEVPFASYDTSRTYTFHEGLAIKTLSEARLLREMANSFLVVATQNGTKQVSSPNWIAKRFSVKRHKEFRCVTTAKTIPEVYIEKRRMYNDNETRIVKSENITLKHKVGNFTWHEGDLLVFEIFKALFEPDFKRKILNLLHIYYNELVARYCTGANDEEDFPLLKGDSVDFMPRNIIRRGKELFHIDSEWTVEGFIPADYVMYRAVMYDVIDSQRPWIGKKIKDFDKFCIELIKPFFAQYGHKRNRKNELLDDSFQDLVVTKGHSKQINLSGRLGFIRNKKVRKFIKRAWGCLSNW